MADFWSRLEGFADRPLSSVEKALVLSGVAFTGTTVAFLPFLPALGALGVAAVAGVLVLGGGAALLRPPKAPKGTVGILVALSPETEAYGIRIHTDFVQALGRFSDGGTETRIAIVEYPPKLAKTIIDRESAERAAFRSRCQVVIYGEARKRRLGGRKTHVITPTLLVRHRTISTARSREFGRTLDRIFPSRMILDFEGDFHNLAVASRMVLAAAQYAIAVAAMLSLELDYAEVLLSRIEATVAGFPRDKFPRSHLRALIRKRLGDIHSLRAERLFRQWDISRDRKYLAESETHVDRVLELSPRDENALLRKAIAAFVLRRDMAVAKRCIRKCRDSKNGTWCYSDAFLNLYDRRLIRARAAYRQAARMPGGAVDDYLQSEIFIHEVLEEEPEKYWLWFGIGTINLFSKEDTAAAASAFEKFKTGDINNEFTHIHVWAEEELHRHRSLEEANDVNTPQPKTPLAQQIE
ncbi:MAG: hypothetical protein IH876_12920 [Gemmatimonadetes bacterium]|nr:hypothetical protein [Gemmatimonadota bacterium]